MAANGKKWLVGIGIACVCSLSGVKADSVVTTRYDEDSGLSQWRVTQMLQDEEGMMWFSTWNGLNRFDGYEFVHFKARPGDGCEVFSNRIRSMRRASAGRIFCRMEHGWLVFNPHDGRFSPLSAEDEKELAVATADHVGHFTPDEEFEMTDRQGNRWRITRNGVLKYTEVSDPIAPFPLERPAAIRCLYRDRTDRYWVGTRDEKDLALSSLALYAPDNRLLGYLSPDGRLHPCHVGFGTAAYCIVQTDSETWWVGCKPGGLFRLTAREGGFRVEHLDHLLPLSVYDIKPDREGRLWLATMGNGLCRIDHPSSARPEMVACRTDSAYPPMKEHRIRRLHWTADGVLLATTTEGLLVMKDGRFRLHRREADRANSLSCNATMDVLEDARHRLWVSTESGGVNEIQTADLMADRLDFRHHDVASGLNSDIALALTENRGELWIVGSNQLMTWHPENLTAGYFDSHFFRRSMRFSETRPLRLPDGRWLFGLEDGAFTLAESQMRKSAYRPPLALTGVALPGQPVRRAVGGLQTLRLRPNERSLTLHFAALDYTEPSSISYAFRMDDEPEWNHIGKNRSVSFWNLSPGTYRLQLRSTNADGVWVDNVRTLTLVVEARFFETWTGRLLLALLGVALLGGILYTFIYIRRIKRQQRETLEAYLDILSRLPGEKETPDSAAEPEPARPAAVDLSEEDRLFMQRVMAFVEAHIGDADLGVNDMAEAAATSRSGLNRKLKSIVGLTPADFLREARIKQACRRLAETDASVADIAYGCGFNDPKYFSKCFKNSVGHSPSDYRELVKKSSEPHLPPL